MNYDIIKKTISQFKNKNKKNKKQKQKRRNLPLSFSIRLINLESNQNSINDEPYRK